MTVLTLNLIHTNMKSILIGIIGLLITISCTADQYYECYDNFVPEQVIIEGREVTIYHKELVCEEY